MDFSRWLSTWLTRHPIKEPSGMGPDYTREVISKLTLESQPARPLRRWLWLFPSPAYALVSAAAVALIVMALLRPHNARLAETTAEDATWIQQTMQLLDELEQSDGSSAGEPAQSQSDEEWIQELEMLDEADLATPS